MATKLSLTRDINGYSTFGLLPPLAADNQNTTLSANSAQTFTINGNYSVASVIFQIPPGAAIFVAHNTTATLPGGSVATSASVLNPVSWQVNQGDTISAITADTSDYFGITTYAIS